MDTQQAAATNPDLPEARERPPRRGISPIWIVPLAALIAGVWLVYKAVAEYGPTIRIHFDNAEGLEAGKTRLKYLSVDLGVVTSVRFATEGTGVEVEAELMPGSEPRLTESTRFWIVKPRLEATGVSGLGTLFSGVYIGMDPGSGGAPRREFTALADPPRILSHQSGSIFTLWSDDLGSLSIGSPVYFRSIEVGSVVSYALSEDHSHVLIEVFVEAPHDRHVDPDTHFWNVSGIQVEASSEGLQVDIESLAALAAGGVAFDSPDAPGGHAAVPEDHLFPLYKNRKESARQVVVGTYPFLVYFDESVRGLSPDAAVEFRGLRVGSVRDILPAKSVSTTEVRIGVLLGIDPQLLPYPTESDKPTGWERRLEWVRRLADSGARAQLKAGNLLTGQKYVDIDLYPNAPPVDVTADMGYPVIPSMPSSLLAITDSLASILAQLESVPIATIGRELGTAAGGMNRLLNSPELGDTLGHLRASAQEFETLLRQLNGKATPVEYTGGLPGLIEDASGAVARFESALAAVEQTASEDGVIGNEALNALRELAAAARAFRAMTEYLQRHPEALVSGKKQGD